MKDEDSETPPFGALTDEWKERGWVDGDCLVAIAQLQKKQTDDKPTKKKGK